MSPSYLSVASRPLYSLKLPLISLCGWVSKVRSTSLLRLTSILSLPLYQTEVMLWQFSFEWYEGHVNGSVPAPELLTRSVCSETNLSSSFGASVFTRLWSTAKISQQGYLMKRPHHKSLDMPRKGKCDWSYTIYIIWWHGLESDGRKWFSPVNVILPKKTSESWRKVKACDHLSSESPSQEAMGSYPE